MILSRVRVPPRDDVEYSERADLTPQEDNLLILGESGDVLEALTRVPELADKYVGKVKLIYIDPPFNTGEAFRHYEDNLEHSVWLTMMRDRLLHMKKLLADEGSIWVHLDDVENHRMRLLLDEVFGSGNFLASLSVETNPKGRQLGQGLARTDDSILGYAKNIGLLQWETGAKESVNLSDFPLRLADGTRYRLLPLRNTNKKFNPKTRPNLYYPLYVDPRVGEVSTAQGDGRVEVWPVFGDGKPAVWRWGSEKAERESADLIGRVVSGRQGERLDIFQVDKAYSGRTKKIKTRWSSMEVGSSDTAIRHNKELFGQELSFSTPKPEELLERIIHIGSKAGDIVLDVFGGSGTTAAVAQKMGRRWVTCELCEPTFRTFARPRLEKVVNDQDPGGITVAKGDRDAVDGVELPDGVTAEDAAKFNSVLKKLVATDPALKKNPVVRALKVASKTEPGRDIVNWRGGGGFQVAHLSPACFDYDPELGMVKLTPEATGELLVASVAANLGFHLLHGDDDFVFDGKRGRSMLKVYEGLATPELVDELLSHLIDGESLVLAATGVGDGVREHLRTARRGSRLVHIPDDIFRVDVKEAGL